MRSRSSGVGSVSVSLHSEVSGLPYRGREKVLHVPLRGQSRPVTVLKGEVAAKRGDRFGARLLAWISSEAAVKSRTLGVKRREYIREIGHRRGSTDAVILSG